MSNGLPSKLLKTRKIYTNIYTFCTLWIWNTYNIFLIYIDFYRSTSYLFDTYEMLKLLPDFLSIANFRRWVLQLAHIFGGFFISRKYNLRFYIELLGFAGSVYLPFLQANRQSLTSGIKLFLCTGDPYYVLYTALLIS